MTLQQVRDALAVAQHGSLHAAARETGQTQPALSKSIQRLEADLGAALFERHARGVRPNATGRQFLAHAKRLAPEADAARDAVAQRLVDRGGRVVFGISAAASLLLAPADAPPTPAARRLMVELEREAAYAEAPAPRLRPARAPAGARRP